MVDGVGSTLAFIGYDPATGFCGGYALNWRVGPDINNPTFYSDGTGTYIRNAPFTLDTTAGDTVSIAASGFQITDGYRRAAVTSGDVSLYDSGTSAWNTAPLRLGNYRIWVDGNGKLRIKNGNPTSDGDGTVVGDQTNQA